MKMIFDDCLQSKFLLLSTIVLFSCSPAYTQTSKPDKPVSPKTTLIQIRPDITLEVLTWGDAGESLVFLAGGGESAHSWTTFAPQFSSKYRVLAVSRRGFGASSKPSFGYDLPTLGEDVRILLDSLGLKQVNLVGFSLGGAEISYLAVNYPEKIVRLIYLDGGFDFRQIYDTPGFFDDWPDNPPISSADSSSLTAFTSYWRRVTAVDFPESEFKANWQFNEAGRLIGRTSIADSIFGSLVVPGMIAQNLKGINRPVLSLYAITSRVEQFFGTFKEMNKVNQDKAHRKLQLWQQIMTKQRNRFKSEVATAKVVEIHDSNHHIFLAQPEKVASEMWRFLENPIH
jgi:pimeloyl-ACP methyl ester carboxylesterase